MLVQRSVIWRMANPTWAGMIKQDLEKPFISKTHRFIDPERHKPTQTSQSIV